MRIFFRFWYDFVVGDDWTIAVAVVVILGATALLAEAGINAWWLVTIGVLAVLAMSVWRAARPNGRSSGRT